MSEFRRSIMAQNKCIETEGVLPLSVASSKDSVAKDYRVYGGTTCNVVQLLTDTYNTRSSSFSVVDDGVNKLLTVTKSGTGLRYGSRLSPATTTNNQYLIIIRIDNCDGVYIKGCYAYDEAGSSFVNFSVNNYTPNTVFSCIKPQTTSDMKYGLQFIFNVDESAIGKTFTFYPPMLFDLTAMFGSGNEPATAQEFAERLGYQSIEDVPYVPYNEGTVMGAGDGQKVSQLVDLSQISSFKNAKIDIDNYNITATNINTNNSFGLILCSVSPNHKTIIRIIVDTEASLPINTFPLRLQYIQNGSVQGYKGYSVNCRIDEWVLLEPFTQETILRLVMFISDNSADSYIKMYKPQLFDLTEMFGAGNEPSTADEFAQRMGYASIEDVPYMEYGEYSRYRIPLVNESHDVTTNIFLTKPLMKIGDVADYVDYKRGVVVRRIGIVDMGTLSWNRYNDVSDRYIWNAQLAGAKAGNAKAFSDIYEWRNWSSLNTLGDGKMQFHPSLARLYLCDNSYTDAASFKTAMSGVILYYELAEPVEEAISLPQLPIYQGNVIDAECTIKPSKVYIKSKK